MTFRVYTDNHLTPEPWRDQAACLEAAPDTWFPETTDEVTARNAKAMCATCPVRDACLEYALRTSQTVGIWGGRTARQLRSIRHARSKP